MEFFDVVQSRHSMRAYKSQPIETDKLHAIFDAANRAPSAGNLQGYEIFAVTNHDALGALRLAAYDQEFISQAPLALVFCANPARSASKYRHRGESLYCVQDATIACAYAQLAATALGLASVWVGAFDEASVRAAIHIGDELLPVAILPIGYPGKEPKIRPRRTLEDLVKWVK